MNEIIKRGKRIYQAGADEDLTDRLRDLSEKHLYVLCKGVMGMGDFTPRLHKPLCEWLTGHKPRKRVLLIPRSCFKTSMCRCMAIHITIQQAASNLYFPGREGRNLRILFAAETERRGLSRIGWIKRQFENNTVFRTLWPELCTAVNTSGWTLSHFSLPRDEDYPEATFEAAGVDSGSTGSHYDVIIKDDLIGLRCRKMPELIPSAIEWFQTSHSLADDLTTHLDYVIGTRWAAYDLYSWIDENETMYDWQVKQIINDDFDPNSILFPERFKIDDIMDLKKKQGELFWLNYMNKAAGSGVTSFDMAFLGSCRVEGSDYGGWIEYDDSEKTKRVIEIIENGGKLTPKPKVKKYWEMSPEERNEQWLAMQKNWYRQKLTQLEIS